MIWVVDSGRKKKRKGHRSSMLPGALESEGVHAEKEEGEEEGD